MLDLKKCLSKWKPIILLDNTDYNENLSLLYAGFLEWESQNHSLSGIYNDLKEIKKSIDENIALYATRKEVKVYLNEYTGQFEYLIDGKFHTRNNISVSNENIKKIFGEKYFNFLVSEKII